MKTLIAIWRIVSLPLFFVAGWLIWTGTGIFRDASTLKHPQTLADLKRERPATAYLVDSVVFDLARSGFGQENVMGVRQAPHAQIPARAASDSADTTSPAPVLLFSWDSTHLGPVLNTLIKAGQKERVVKSTETSVLSGKEIKADVLITQTAEKYADQLELPTRRRERIEGVAHLRSAAEYQVEGVASEVWVVRLGVLPTVNQAILRILGGIAILAISLGLFFLGRKMDRERRAQEELELESQGSLV